MALQVRIESQDTDADSFELVVEVLRFLYIYIYNMFSYECINVCFEARIKVSVGSVLKL